MQTEVNAAPISNSSCIPERSTEESAPVLPSALSLAEYMVSDGSIPRSERYMARDGTTKANVYWP